MEVDSPKELLHKILWNEFENENAVPCFVEISLESLSNKQSIKFYRGVTSRGFEHKIDDKIVSKSFYEQKLTGLDLFINLKNIIFGKKLFYEFIWGDQEDLEQAVTKILRATSSLDEWKKIKEKLTYMKETKKILNYKNFKKMKKFHDTVEKFVYMFNCVELKKEILQDSLNLEEVLEDDSLPPSLSCSKPEFSDKKSCQVIFQDMITLEDKRNSLLDRYQYLEKKEKLLYSQLFFNEVRISSKLTNTSILQAQITKLKGKLRMEEKYLSLLWKKMEETDNELKDLQSKITMSMGRLWDIQESFYLKNKITLYGRFIDYFEPNSFVNTLRKILGENIFNGNLCDDMQTAVFYSDSLKKMKYKKRENFLIFNSYSPKLKDLLLGSGEEGIKIKNIQELQIFLCKLKQYELISSVPVIIERKFKFKLKEGHNYKDDIIYPHDGIFLKSDGLIMYYNEPKVNLETEKSLLESVNSWLIEQGLKYEEYRNLLFKRFETLQNMTDLEKDIFYLKNELNKHANSRFVLTLNREVSNVDNPYIDLFMEHGQQIEDLQREIEESEDYLSTSKETHNLSENGENSTLESLLTSMTADLDEIENKRIGTKKELSELENQLRILDVTSSAVSLQPALKFLPFGRRKMVSYFYYKKELEDLKRLLSKNEVDEFENWKEWRKEIIDSFIQDTGKTDESLKALETILETLTISRKKVLSPLLEHCSIHLTHTLNLMMDTSLPFLELTMNQFEDCLQLVTSSSENLVNLIDVRNLNTFSKFIAILTLFLELAVYDKIPIIIFDDMDEFFPLHKDNFEAVMSENSLKRVAAFKGTERFQVILRMLQFFEFFIKKNRSDGNIRKIRNHTEDTRNGPTQVIFFTNGDLAHFTEHQIWIQSKLLPDEYMTNDCNMQSFLQDINFK